jgi:hypothetical protein
MFGKETEDTNKPHKWAMNPLQAAHRAKMMVKSAAQLGVELDFSPDSLTNIDMLIDKERETGIGMTKEMEFVMLSLGAYVGEVMVKHLDAKWVSGADSATQDPLLILIDNKFAINVISIVLRRFVTGPPNSAATLYEETKKLNGKT